MGTLEFWTFKSHTKARPDNGGSKQDVRFDELEMKQDSKGTLPGLTENQW